jgi:septum formation protein
MKSPPLILASKSPRRLEMLRSLGIEVVVIIPDVVEDHPPKTSPEETALRNACKKTRAVVPDYRDHAVLGADTIVVMNGEIFGKPKDIDVAMQMLARLQGKMHEVITGVCLWCGKNKVERTFLEKTKVWMRPLTRPEIRDYFQKTDPLDKAGAYAIQEFGSGIVDRIEGSYSNVVGLPLEAVRRELLSLGFPVPHSDEVVAS